MSGSVNKVILVGNLGKDPEIRSSQNGRLASFSIATSETWNDRASGERRQRVEWHRVVIFNDRLVNLAERFLRKGSQVYLEGSLQTRKWTDQGGQERYTTEVVLSKFRGDIQMLARVGRDADDYDGGDQDYEGSESAGDYGAQTRSGSGFSSSGYGGAPASQSPAQGNLGGWDSSTGDLDDEIPF